METLSIIDVASHERYQKGCFELLCHHSHLVLAINFRNRWEFQLHLLDLQSVYACDERGTCSVIIYEYCFDFAP